MSATNEATNMLSNLTSSFSKMSWNARNVFYLTIDTFFENTPFVALGYIITHLQATPIAVFGHDAYIRWIRARADEPV